MLDPKSYADWQIAESAEKTMKPIGQIAHELGLLEEELLPYGRFVGKVDAARVLARTRGQAAGKYINVTAITPVPMGIGKSTTTIGLVQGLGRLGKRAAAAIRQPSGGPTMGRKGSAAGGGLAQCIPLARYSLGLTGDINAVTNANNLALVALTARMQHERNYSDETLLRLSGRPRLNIDPTRVEMRWAMDFCCQALRNIIIGIDGEGGQRDGFMMRSQFAIAVASEVMAILALSRDLKDMRQRMAKIIVARTMEGAPVTTADLEVDGAMTAWMVEAINPSLVQTIEGQPVFVHAGPFADIAIGQSSVIADMAGVKLVDYHVTESGFGSDVGYEKFWNLKSRYNGITPDCAVIVATISALKHHGGLLFPANATRPTEEFYRENVGLVEAGCENLLHHIGIVKKSGVTPVVCLNAFVTDTPAEWARVREICRAEGVRMAVSHQWERGGEGAEELAGAVVDACNEPSVFTPLYDWNLPYVGRIEKIATEVYGANGVDFSPRAKERLELLEKDTVREDTAVCMVKTSSSLSDVPGLAGVPKNWTLKVRDLLYFGGAGFIVPVAGNISLMPGTGSSPAFRGVDVDTDTGCVTGIL